METQAASFASRGSGKRAPRARPPRHPSRDSPHGESHRTRGRLAVLRQRRVALLGGDGTLHAAANLPPGPLSLRSCPRVERTTSPAPRVTTGPEGGGRASLLRQPRWIDLINAHDRPAQLPRRRRGQRRLARARSGELQRAELSRSCRRGTIGLSGQRERSTESRSVSSATACPRCSPSASSSSQPRLLRLRTACCSRRPAGRRSPPRGQPPVEDGRAHPDDRATSARDTRQPPWHTQPGPRSASGSRRVASRPHRGHNEPRDGAGDARGRPAALPVVAP